jgi:L-asparagine permease
MYFFNWACTSIVDVTAIALCMHYWGALSKPSREFWAALIKVVALVTFLVVAPPQE